MSRTILMFFTIIGFVGIFLLNFFSAVALTEAKATGPTVTVEKDNDVSTVICNVILFVQKLGLPIMTGVILGSSIMAIFGKLPWPAIVMLVVFTAIFFGAGKLVSKFVQGINNNITSGTDCTTSTTSSPAQSKE